MVEHPETSTRSHLPFPLVGLSGGGRHKVADTAGNRVTEGKPCWDCREKDTAPVTTGHQSRKELTGEACPALPLPFLPAPAGPSQSWEEAGEPLLPLEAGPRVYLLLGEGQMEPRIGVVQPFLMRMQAEICYPRSIIRMGS